MNKLSLTIKTIALSLLLMVPAAWSCSPDQIMAYGKDHNLPITQVDANKLSQISDNTAMLLSKITITAAPVASTQGCTLPKLAKGEKPLTLENIQIICYIQQKFAGTGHEMRAVRVAKCESHWTANPPHNNPHYGVFQMGKHEFATYGTGSTFNAKNNIDSAFNYWNATGRKWGPWQCKGQIGISL